MQVTKELVYNFWSAKKAEIWVVVVDSHSMRPFLQGEVSVCVQMSQGINPQKGDIVLFRTLRNYQVVHRIVNIDNLSYLQMADNYVPGLPGLGEWIQRNHILGVVKQVKWKSGDKYVIVDLQSRMNRVIGRIFALFLSWQWHWGNLQIKGYRTSNRLLIVCTGTLLALIKVASALIFRLLKVIVVLQGKFQDEQ